jgi:hypothetical protein
MNHSFNLALANKFGINISIFLQSIAFWTHNNLANKKNIIDGHCWTYNTLDALTETFTYWTRRQLETVIKNCIESGLLIKANHNQTKYDRTCWYALTSTAYEFFPELCQEHFIERILTSISPNCEIDFTELRNGFHTIVTPIPVTNPITKDKDNTTCDNLPKTIEPKPIPKEKVFSINHALEDNPHEIPQEHIQQWMLNRGKFKVTRLVWDRINRILSQLKDKGIDPLDAFDRMVTAGWRSIELTYFDQEMKKQEKQEVDFNSTDWANNYTGKWV